MLAEPKAVPKNTPANEPSKAAQFVLKGYEVRPASDGTFVVSARYPVGIEGNQAGFSTANDLLAWLTAGHTEVVKGQADGWF